jgi:hypothetical protein
MSDTETPQVVEAQEAALPSGAGAPDDESGTVSSGWWLFRMPPSPRTLRLLVTLGAVVALLVLLPALLSANRNAADATRARPTATPQPPTPVPSPTALPGYQPLVDATDGFVIQYPLAWSCAPSNPGVDCIDSPDAQTFRLQVQLPSNWSSADVADPTSGAAWVDYALSAFSDVPGRTFQRVPVTNPPASIGGATWQSGAAIVGIEQPGASGGSGEASPTPVPQEVRIRVQVYATVHNGTPFVIAVYAADDKFAAGSSQYFQPMLRTFAFLPNDNDAHQ